MIKLSYFTIPNQITHLPFYVENVNTSKVLKLLVTKINVSSPDTLLAVLFRCIPLYSLDFTLFNALFLLVKVKVENNKTF